MAVVAVVLTVVARFMVVEQLGLLTPTPEITLLDTEMVEGVATRANLAIEVVATVPKE
jgi:hypothetical protein